MFGFLSVPLARGRCGTLQSIAARPGARCALVGGRGVARRLPVRPAGEAVIGLFIELVFVATFSRRFLGN